MHALYLLIAVAIVAMLVASAAAGGAAPLLGHAPATPEVVGGTPESAGLVLDASANITLCTSICYVGFTATASGGTAPYTFKWNFQDGSFSTAQNPDHAYTNGGWYNATVYANDSKNNSAESQVLVHVQGFSVAATATPNPASYAPETVEFGAIVGGVPPYTFSWTFTNGVSASGQRVNETFSSPGVYTGTVTVYDGQGLEGNANATIVVSTPLQPQIFLWAAPSNGTAPLRVNFTAELFPAGFSSYAWSWDYGSAGSAGFSTTGNWDNSTFDFTNPGTYVVRVNLTVSSGAIFYNTTQIAVLGVSPPPSSFSVALWASPTNGTAPLDVSFLAQVSGGTGPFDYAWAFGNGESVEGTGMNATSTQYAVAGAFTATVTVTDAEGYTAEASSVITVSPSAGSQVEVFITASPASGYAPLLVQFAASTYPGCNCSFLWMFGDGANSTGVSTTHAYESPGYYEVQAYAIAPSGIVGQGSTWVEVLGSQQNSTGDLTAKISDSASQGASPFDDAFQGSASGGSGEYSYFWNFGDGSGASGSAVSHTFMGEGQFLVSLEVIDSAGAVAWAFTSVEVSAGSCGNCTAPPALTAPTVVVVGTTATFTVHVAASPGNYPGEYSVRMSYGDGSYAMASSAEAGEFTFQHAYAAVGTYHVSVIVSSSTEEYSSSATSVLQVQAAASPAPQNHGGTPIAEVAVIAVVLAGIVVAWCLALYYRGRRGPRQLESPTAPTRGEVLDPYAAYRPVYNPTPRPSDPVGPGDLLAPSSQVPRSGML